MNIGIENTKNVAQALNQYLADLRVLYSKVQNYHWNLTGSSFFALHEKYEEYYDFLNEQVDEIAERILTLGETPLSSLKDFLNTAKIKEADSKPVKDSDSVKTMLEDFEYMIRQQREIISIAEDSNDPGTADMLTASIETFEKNCWMLRAYLNK